MQGYVVNLDIKGLTNSILGLRQVAQAAKMAQAAVKAIGPMPGGAGGGGGGTGGGTGGRGGGTGIRRPSKPPVIDPYAAYVQRRLQNQAFAQAFKNQYGPKQQSAAAKAFKQLVYSTRVGVGANGGVSIMPLVGNLVKFLGALGPEAEIAAVALTALGAAAAALVAVIKTGVEYGNAQAQAYLAGGTAAETAKLGGIARGAGLTQQQVTDMARAFGEQLKNDPYDMAIAAAHGYAPNYGGKFGDMNDARRFEMAFKDMMSMSQAQAAKFARGTSLENLLWMTNLSPDMKKQALADQGQKLSPSQLTQTADAQYQYNKLMGEYNKELVDLAIRTLPATIQSLKDANELARSMRGNHSGVPGAFGNPTPAHAGVEDVGPNDPRYAKYKQQADSISGLSGSLDQNTQATLGNTHAINGQKQTYGGGPGAQGAIPGQYFNPNNASTRQQVSLGQIPI